MSVLARLFSPATQVALAVVLALVPGLHRYWSGRRIYADDPALPERLMSRRGADARVTAICLALLVAFGWPLAWWTVPLAILGLATAAWPLRRRVLGETWGLPAYLAWTLRLVLGVWGFWLLLVATPLVLASIPPPSLPAGVALAAALALWNQFYAPLLLRLVAARPFEPGEWPAGFRRVLDGARVPEPRIWRAGPRGSRLANALALPSLRGHHVLFTDALLECLDEEEAAAVLAHEVSHLELFTRRLLVRWQVSSLALVLGGVLLVPVVEATAPQREWLALVGWFVAVASVLAARGRVVRAQEHPSDRRAVELSGNAEAVVSGLVKLHETARLPRRWAAAFEQRASHPSLARRIQAIRAAAGQRSAPVAFPMVLRGTDGTALVLEADRVRHLSGVPPDIHATDALLAAASAAVAVPWAEIAELRVEAQRTRGPVLVVGHVKGQRWTVPLDRAGVPAVQAALDSVDDRLPATLPAIHDGRTARIALVGLCAAVLVSLSASSALVAAVLALVVPSPAALLVAGVAALVAAALAVGQAASQPRIVLDLLIAAPALWTLWLARRWRRGDGPPDRVVHVLVGLSGVALWIAVLAYTRGDLFELHDAARVLHGLAVLPLALAAGWTWAAEPRFRRGVVVPLLLGLVGLVVSTTWFVDAVVREPLRAPGPRLEPAAATLEPIAEAPLGQAADQVWLSPSGRVFATSVEPEDEDSSEPSTFTIGDFAGRRSALRADFVAIPDDETILAVERAEEGLAISAHPVADAAQTTWTVRLPAKGWGTFTVNPVSRRWRFAQTGAKEATAWEGAIGTAEITVRSTPASAVMGGYSTQWIAADGAPIGVVYDYSRDRPTSVLLRELLGLRWRMPLTLRLGSGGDVRSRLDGTCSPAPPGAPVACVVRDGTRSHLWTWDGRSLAPAGWLDDELVVQGRDASGWIAGWRRGRLTLVLPGTARVFDVAGTCGRGQCLAAATYTGTVLGGLLTRGGTVTVATYRVRALSPPPR